MADALAPATDHEMQADEELPEAHAESRMATDADIGCSAKERFEMELEFVQALANPNYLNWLAQNRYFEDAAFLRYLQYLQYFKRKEYSKYIKFPHCLHFLDLLQQPEFRARMARQDFSTAVAWQQYYFWLHYRKNRVKEALEVSDDKVAEGEATAEGAMETG